MEVRVADKMSMSKRASRRDCDELATRAHTHTIFRKRATEAATEETSASPAQRRNDSHPMLLYATSESKCCVLYTSGIGVHCSRSCLARRSQVGLLWRLTVELCEPRTRIQLIWDLGPRFVNTRRINKTNQSCSPSGGPGPSEGMLRDLGPLRGKTPIPYLAPNVNWRICASGRSPL